MNIFSNNIPLALFACLTIGLFAGWCIGIVDGRQREIKDQQYCRRVQRALDNGHKVQHQTR